MSSSQVSTAELLVDQARKCGVSFWTEGNELYVDFRSYSNIESYFKTKDTYNEMTDYVHNISDQIERNVNEVHEYVDRENRHATTPPKYIRQFSILTEPTGEVEDGGRD